MSAPPSALRAARDAKSWSQTEAARALADLARTCGVPVASVASLKTQLSRWENGHATPEAQYRVLLAELYAESGLDPAFARTEATDAAERLRARLATAAAVDTQVIALWRTQLSTVQQLDDRLGAAGAASAARALIEQLEAVLPHLPDPDRRRPVAALLARACLLAGNHALDAGEPDAAVARFARVAEVARIADAPELAAEAAVGHAEALVEVGASGEARAVLDHAGIDLAHPPPGLRVELAQGVLRRVDQEPGGVSAEPSSASAAP